MNIRRLHDVYEENKWNSLNLKVITSSLSKLRKTTTSEEFYIECDPEAVATDFYTPAIAINNEYLIEFFIGDGYPLEAKFHYIRKRVKSAKLQLSEEDGEAEVATVDITLVDDERIILRLSGEKSKERAAALVFGILSKCRIIP